MLQWIYGSNKSAWECRTYQGAQLTLKMLNACLIVSDHIFVLSSQDGDLAGHISFKERKIICSSAQNLLAWATDGTKLLVIHCEPMQILVLGLRVVYQDLSTCHAWPVKKAIVNCQSGWREIQNAFPAICWVFLGAQNKDMGTALQTLCLKPGLNFVCDTGYKHSLHKDSKDGFKDMGFCCIGGTGFLRVLIIFSCCVTLSWSFLKAVSLSKKLF